MITDNSFDEEGLGEEVIAPLSFSTSSFSPGVWASLLPKKKADQEAWQWIQQYDELSQALTNHQVMHGFIEGPIHFPPSYRWDRWADTFLVQAFTNVDNLEKAYSLKVKGKDRTPSYTDR